jgi:hypothetical protein
MVADDGDIYILLDRFTNYDEKSSGPEAKWDWFGVGGQWKDMLKLNRPRKLRRFFGLLPAGETTTTAVAKKSEIDQEALLADPPAALFVDNVLYECPIFAEGDDYERWKVRFAELFKAIPNDRTLQIVDAHS